MLLGGDNHSRAVHRSCIGLGDYATPQQDYFVSLNPTVLNYCETGWPGAAKDVGAAEGVWQAFAALGSEDRISDTGDE